MTVMRKAKSVGALALFSLIPMLLSCLNIIDIIYMHIYTHTYKSYMLLSLARNFP